MIRSSEYRFAPNQQIPPYPCTAVEEVAREQGVVPHHLPGTNPFLKEFGEKYNLPLEATLGGAGDDVSGAGAEDSARAERKK